MTARRTIIVSIAVAASAVLALGAATPAGAHGTGHGSHGWLTGGGYYQAPTLDKGSVEINEDCGDFQLEGTAYYRNVQSIRNVPGTHGQAFLAKNVYRFFEKWRNPANGKRFTIQGNGVFQERAAKFVPRYKVPAEAIPPEGLVGPVYSFFWTDRGVQFWMKDAHGRTVAKEAGTILGVTTYDTLGDHTPGATWLLDEWIKFKGSYDTFETSLCDLARPVVAPHS